jgi:molybdopterin-containing oxidoreductase family membrane subunit
VSANWGYVAGVAAFLLSAAQLGPVVALISRLGRGTWGTSLEPIADRYALAGVVTAPLFILVLGQLPDWRGRASIWFDWPGAPQVWDSVAIVGLALAGIGLLAIQRRTKLHRMRTRPVILVGALYTMLAVFVHLLVSSDLAISLVPGWHSAVVPASQVASGLEAAIALVVLTAAITRATNTHAMAAAGKLLLAFALLWFYFFWCELLTDWYGRTPDEQAILGLLFGGPSLVPFTVAFACMFALPLLVLMWNAARNSPRVVTGVAALIVFGSLVDRLRLYVGAWSWV